MKKFKVYLPDSVSNKVLTIKADSYTVSPETIEFFVPNGNALRRVACINKNCVVGVVEN
jgi:hypothetical protein